MAKSFFTMGQQAGFDMTSEVGLQSFMAAYNAQAMEQFERRQAASHPDTQTPGFEANQLVHRPPVKRPDLTAKLTSQQRRQRAKKLKGLQTSKRR